MDKSKFLKELRDVLSNEVSAQAVRENVDYYSQYIDDEIRKGRTEKEVMDELGDPWVIAKTIIDASEMNQGDSYTYDAPKNDYNGGNMQYTQKTTSGGSEKGLMHTLKIILIIGVVFFVVIGIFRILAPLFSLAIPIICVVAVIRYFKNRTGGGY